MYERCVWLVLFVSHDEIFSSPESVSCRVLYNATLLFAVSASGFVKRGVSVYISSLGKGRALACEVFGSLPKKSPINLLPRLDLDAFTIAALRASSKCMSECI